jgi:hypothetical protein
MKIEMKSYTLTVNKEELIVIRDALAEFIACRPNPQSHELEMHAQICKVLEGDKKNA